MRDETEDKLFLAVLFTCIFVLGVCGVVVLLAGMTMAFDAAGTIDGAYAIGVSVFGLLMCGAAGVLFAALWPERKT